jgi:hypothetical protein
VCVSYLAHMLLLALEGAICRKQDRTFLIQKNKFVVSLFKPISFKW